MPKIKKILIANRGEIACRVIKTARKMGVVGFVVFSMAGCASSSSGGAPSFISSSKIESMADESWADLTQTVGLSSNQILSDRFETITSKVIAVSDLANEDWDIKLLNGTSGMFSMPGNRLGASEAAIVDVSDDQLASMAAFAVASLELKHVEKMISRKKMGDAVGSFGALLGGKRDKRLSAISGPLPPTIEMRREATTRAAELLELSGFNVDFLISSNPMNLHGPVK